MARSRPLFYLLPELWHSLVSQPCTVGYPFEPAVLPAGFRGRVVVDPDKCKGCGLCVRDCPAFALELQRESRDKYKLIYYPDRCAYCGQCEISCHADAISLQNDFVHAIPERDTLKVVLVDHDKGRACDVDGEE